MTQTITILHLSDLHFSEERRWDADPVLHDLTRIIADDIKSGPAPDVVAITGDIADRGTSRDYEYAKSWIETRLLAVLPDSFPREHLLIIPGNHDVDRTQLDEAAESLQDRLLSTKDQNRIAKVLDDNFQRSVLLRSHSAYIEFANTFRNQPIDVPWWSSLLKFGGVRVNFAGLCSSWMSSGDKDHSSLLLGRWQINHVLADAEEADFTVALLHHPWSYLAEFDGTEAEAIVHRRCHLVLRGHLHRIDSRYVIHPGMDCIELAAGAAYAGSDHPNAFQWIMLDPATGRLHVHFRQWQDGRWLGDRNQVPDEAKGIAEFTLSSACVRQSSGNSLITELVADFVGREFLNCRLDKFLQHEECGYFILEGEPGIGKSAWAAQLVVNRSWLHHFNMVAEGVMRTEQCHRRLCNQLVERYPSLPRTDSPSTAFDVERLHRLLEHASSMLGKDEKLVIVIDALDEAERPQPGSNVLCLPQRLPKGIYFVLTTRPSADRPLRIESPQETFCLAPSSLANLADIKTYILAFLNRHPDIQQHNLAEYSNQKRLVTHLQERSEGNFMYLHYVLPEIAQGNLDLKELPLGLTQYYDNHWQKMRSRDEHRWIAVQQPVLCVLAATLEPLMADEIQAFASRGQPAITKPEVSSVLAEWRPFLRVSSPPVQRRCYSIYHKSFQDFLRRKDEVGEIDLKSSHSQIADLLKNAFEWWRVGKNSPG